MILLIILLLTVISPAILFSARLLNQRSLNTLSQLFIFAVFVLCILSPSLLPNPYNGVWQLPIFNSLHVNIVIHFDSLTWVMLSLVSFVSLIIHGYASRYLLSDQNQTRFMAQLSILTFSVMLLMMSGSLLTAFIGWQFIGLSLYLLLNHYHYDIKANKAAKKKFMINRVGDICFLIAVIIAFRNYGNTQFQTLFYHQAGINTTILALIFIAIMTKSAQFPFHIWLIDTMEAPTPVSALMHAGVINAGGFLLARLSPLYDRHPQLLLFVFIIGLVTALLGNFFMQNQSDIKKQLAYSTMGQMGYMVMQCGLGCFGSAVFHLIAHGFFKASSFLAAGSNLSLKNRPNIRSSHHTSQPHILLFSLLLSIVSIMLGIYYFSYSSHTVHINPLLWLFIAISLFQLFNKAISFAEKASAQITGIITIAVVYLVYLILLKHFNFLLSNSVLELKLNFLGYVTIAVVTIVILLAALFYSRIPIAIQRKILLKLFIFGCYKFNIEKFYRQYLVNPIRNWGDRLLHLFKHFKALKIVALTSIFLWLIAIITTFALLENNTEIHPCTSLLTINLILFIILLLTANRVSGLKPFITNIFLLNLSIAGLALILRQYDLGLIGGFQLINSFLIVLGFALLLLRPRTTKPNTKFTHNKLPWSHFYMSVFLMLSIGIPGTASFISELFLLNGLLGLHFYYAIIFGIGIILLALVILHTLQIHFFNPKAIAKYAFSVPCYLHIICVIFIAFNIFNGIYPYWLLHTLSKVTGG